MLKFISTIFYVIFIAILVGIAGLVLGTMLPIPGNIEMKIVKSGSMEPAIPTGSVVVVKPQGDYRVNDVITFGEDTKTQVPTTHRILAIEGTGAQAVYTTKGDANEEQDANTVARREVIGKVIFSLPYAGFVLDFARQPIGFVLLIAVPAVLVILEEVLTIVREARRWNRRRDNDGDGSPTSSDSDTGAPPSRGRGPLDLRGAPRIIYSRFRMMDEILVPMLEDMSESFARRMA
ncbi:MAG: signal peptidase I, partial [Minisyncoccia bacterium]